MKHHIVQVNTPESAQCQRHRLSAVASRLGAAVLLLGSSSAAFADSVIEDKLTPSYYTASQQYFGEAVDLQGEFLIAAAPRTLSTGDVYIYKHGNGRWQEVERLLPPADVDHVSRFGQSVALVDGYAFVGVGSVSRRITSAWGIPTQSSSGAVFVYERIRDNRWDLVRRFYAADQSDGYAYDIDAVRLSNGYVLAVGAPFTRIDGRPRGSVHVYTPAPLVTGNNFTGGTYTTATLAPSDIASTDHFHFGKSVALDGDSLMVGAPRWYDDNGNRRGSGRAYLYDLLSSSSNYWIYRQQFGHGGHDYGISVALQGRHALIGDPCGDSRGCGDAVLFTENAGTDMFELSTRLPKDGVRGSVHYGAAVALYDDRALVGAESGEVMHFKRVFDTDWNALEDWRTSNHPIWPATHSSLAIDAEHSAVGEIYYDNQPGRNTDTGRVTVRRHLEFEVPEFDITCDWREIWRPRN